MEFFISLIVFVNIESLFLSAIHFHKKKFSEIFSAGLFFKTNFLRQVKPLTLFLYDAASQRLRYTENNFPEHCIACFTKVSRRFFFLLHHQFKTAENHYQKLFFVVVNQKKIM
jgi:hypothetical protein